MPKPTGFETLDNVYNNEALDWLEENAPRYANAVRDAVGAGRTPEEIYYRTLDKLGTHRRALAVRMRNAAQALAEAQ